MKIKELSELIDETRDVLVKDFNTTNHKEPTQKDLVNHIKKLFNDGEQDSVLGELFLDEIDCPEDFYKLLLLSAVHSIKK
jgi:hypothetical protein